MYYKLVTSASYTGIATQGQSPAALSGLADVEPSHDETKTCPAKTVVTEELHEPGNNRVKDLQEKIEVRSQGVKRSHPPLPHIKSFDKLPGSKRPCFTKKLAAISLKYEGRFSQTHLVGFHWELILYTWAEYRVRSSWSRFHCIQLLVIKSFNQLRMRNSS